MENVATKSVWVIAIIILAAFMFVVFSLASFGNAGVILVLALGVAGFAIGCFLLNTFFVARGEEDIQTTLEKEKKKIQASRKRASKSVA